MNAEAVIFDMDGVLVDSEHLIKKCETEVLEEQGVEVTEKDIEEHEGMATEEYFKKMMEEKHSEDFSDEELHELAEQMVERKLELYFENMDEIKVIEGAPESVKELSERMQVAVASNSERKMVEAVVEHLEIGEHLNAVSSFSDVDNGKPEPDVFLHAAEEMDAEPENTMVLEDSVAGTTASVKGGFQTYRFRRESIEGIKGVVETHQEFKNKALTHRKGN